MKNTDIIGCEIGISKKKIIILKEENRRYSTRFNFSSPLILLIIRTCLFHVYLPIFIMYCFILGHFNFTLKQAFIFCTKVGKKEAEIISVQNSWRRKFVNTLKHNFVKRLKRKTKECNFNFLPNNYYDCWTLDKSISVTFHVQLFMDRCWPC